MRTDAPPTPSRTTTRMNLKILTHFVRVFAFFDNSEGVRTFLIHTSVAKATAWFCGRVKSVFSSFYAFVSAYMWLCIPLPYTRSTVIMPLIRAKIYSVEESDHFENSVERENKFRNINLI